MKSLLLLLCLATTLIHAAEPHRVLPYKQMGDVRLNLHAFFPPKHQANDAKPAIIFFFAGGWVGGDAKQFFRQCDYLASRGIVAISAEYRIKKKHHTSPKECVMDAKSAVRWVRSHADKLGVDPEKIIAGGGSAGGHIAAATAFLKAFEPAGEDARVSSRPNALVLYNPVIDNGPNGFAYNRVQAYWKAISVLHNITPDGPPTCVFFADQDKYIPTSTAEAFKAAMDAVGNRCDYTLYAGEAHGFFNQSKYRETLIETDRFLESLGFLKGEPTL